MATQSCSCEEFEVQEEEPTRLSTLGTALRRERRVLENSFCGMMSTVLPLS
jgi:hypothetical protein